MMMNFGIHNDRVIAKMAECRCDGDHCSNQFNSEKFKIAKNNYANCVHLQCQLSEVLFELSSTKYIIELLQKDISRITSPDHEQHMLNPMTEGRQWSSHNRVSTQDQPNRWIRIHPKYSDKLH